MSERRSWADTREEIMRRPGVGAAYDAARLRHELGAAVRERRVALGLSQADLAARAGMQQPAIARFESGGTTPTLPVLERLAGALDMRLSVHFVPLSEAS